MKKNIIAIVALTIICSLNASAFDPKDLLNGLKAAATSSSSSKTEDTNTSSGILGALGSFINNTLSNNEFTVDDLVGTWNYASPCVSFKSENALMKIGGAGAATALEGKLEPYYKKLGFTATSLVVDEEHNFKLKLGVVTLEGTIEKEEESLVFNFSAFKTIPLGKLSANATKLGTTLNLTFDATKLIQLLTKISSYLNVSTINTLGSLLNSYDGVFIGFKLNQKAAE